MLFRSGVAGAGSELAGQYAEELGFTPGQQLGARLLGGLTGGFAAPTAIGAGEKLAKILPPSARRIEKEGENILRTVLAEQLPKGASETLAQVGKVGDEYFKPTSGKLLGTEKIMALENEFAKTSEEIASRNLENIRGIAQKTGKGLEEVGATPEESQAYYKNILDTIKNRTDEELAAATAARDEKTLSVINPAAEKADAIKKSVEEGKITAEEGYKKTQEAYEQAFKSLKENANVNEMNASSEIVFDKIDSQRKDLKKVVNSLYNEASREVPDFYQTNTFNVKDTLKEMVGEERRFPTEIKRILLDISEKPTEKTGLIPKKTYIPDTETEKEFEKWLEAFESEKTKPKLKPRKLSQLLADIRTINGKIREAKLSPSKSTDIAVLQKFKDALNEDINSLEGVSEKLKIANNFFRNEYAINYKEGASKNAYKQADAGYTSNTINQFIPDNVKNVKEEDIKRLDRKSTRLNSSHRT